jgi:hypothetical protein
MRFSNFYAGVLQPADRPRPDEAWLEHSGFWARMAQFPITWSGGDSY